MCILRFFGFSPRVWALLAMTRAFLVGFKDLVALDFNGTHLPLRGWKTIFLGGHGKQRLAVNDAKRKLLVSCRGKRLIFINTKTFLGL